MRRDVLEAMMLIKGNRPDITGMPISEARVARWVEPRLLADVAYTEITPDWLLRHTSFKGISAVAP
jgi:bifunctional non-homologous end joining protein LigD